MSGYVPAAFKQPIKELNNARIIVDGNYRYCRSIKVIVALTHKNRPGEIFRISPTEYPIILDWLEQPKMKENRKP